MNNFIKLINRSQLSSLLLILFLLFAIIVASIGYCAYSSSSTQLKEIDGKYTTIGIQSGNNSEKIWLVGKYNPEGTDSIRFEDGSLYIGPKDALAAARQSLDFLESNTSILLSASVKDCMGLTSGTMDIMDYNAELDKYCYQLSVLAVRCISIEEGIPIDYFNWNDYTATFEIVAAVCRMDAYDLPPENGTISVYSRLYTEDGEYPFEVGKTYLIRGRYEDYPISDTHQDWVELEDGTKQLQWVRARDVEYSSRDFQMEGYSPMVEITPDRLGITPGLINYATEKVQYPNSDLCYWRTPDGCWPYYAEYEGDWLDYLESEEGRVWREEIIPDCERNHTSVSVILTNNIDHLYSFNTGDTSILEGREITREEYASGANVCLVSAAYAKHNALAVGDNIHLDYYDTGCVEAEYGLGTHNGRTGMTVQRAPLSDESYLDIQIEYQIVGIYIGSEWQPGLHSFHADTVFVPMLSVPYAESRVENTPTMLNSIVIENGSIDTFEAHMAASDKAGAYLYFDQGYTEAAATVQTLIDNAKRIMIVGISMFFLSSLLFLLLFIRRTAPVIRTMRLLGVSVQETWSECFISLISQVVIAVLVGNALAIVLYDRITQMVLSASLELSYGRVALCGGVQFLVLFVVGIVWTHSVANCNLMQKR